MAVNKVAFKAKHGLQSLENSSFSKAVTITGALTVNNAITATKVTMTGTDAMKIPTGNTAQRGTPTDGLFRANTETFNFEGYINGSWVILGGTTSLKTAAYQNIELISPTAGLGHELISGDAGVRFYRDVATFNEKATPVTGAIRFQFPVGAQNTATMYRMRITGFNYTSNQTWTLELSCYYNAASWIASGARATLTGSAPFSMVRLGVTPEGRLCVIIGEVTTSWSYPAVVVETFMPSYGGVVRDWHQGWGADKVTDLSTHTGLLTSVLEVVYTSTNFNPTLKYDKTGGAISGAVTMASTLGVTGNATFSALVTAANFSTVGALTVPGGTLSTHLSLNDNAQIKLGTGDDLLLYHNGSHSYIDQNVVGHLYIRNNVTSGSIYLQAKDSAGTLQNAIQVGVGSTNCSVIFDSGVERFRTNSTGAAVTGNLTASGSITATGNITAYSDERLKENVEVITNGLAKVCELSGVLYDRIDTKTRETGLIAQHVRKVLPEAVIPVDDSEDAILTVAYGNTVGLLVEAIKELKGMLDEVKLEIAGMKGEA